MRKLILITFYAAIAFCVISFLSVFISLLSTVGTNNRPVANLGFPFQYYYQFWLRGMDGPNCGWVLNYFVWDWAITWAITAVVYLFIKRKP